MDGWVGGSWMQIRSVAQSCPTLCDPMNRSMPGLQVHHQLPEFTQTHVHQVSDAIQPSHPLSSPSPPAPNPSQHQSLFQWVNSSHGGGQSTGVSASTSVLPMNTQDWFPLKWTPCSPRSPFTFLKIEVQKIKAKIDLLDIQGTFKSFSNATVQKHQLFYA